MKIKNIVLIITGYLFLTLGAVGIFIPVLPTTPFILAAAFCFSAASPKIYSRIKNNSFFGPYIENYKNKQGVKMPLKISSVVFVWIGLIISMAVIQTVWVYILLSIIGVAVTVHILMIRTKK